MSLLLAAAGVVFAYPFLPGLSPHLDATADLRFAQVNTLFNNPKPEAVVHWIRDVSPDAVFLEEVSSKTQQIPASLAAEYPSQII